MRAGRSRFWFLSLLAVLTLVLTACPADEEEPAAPEAPDDTEAPDDDEEEDDVAAPEGEPIRIGFVGELSGPFAVWGNPARNGMRLAVQEINDAGGVNGRPLELVERDTGGSPDEGVTAFRELIEREGIVAAGGLISSDVGLATSRVAEEEQVPVFMVKAGAAEILTMDSRYTFRTCLSSAQMITPPLSLFFEQEGLTRVGAIIADYAWGHSMREAIEDHIVPAEGIEVQFEIAPVPETDFTTYLRRLEAFDPEVLLTVSHPPATIPVTRQSAELGVGQYVIGPYFAIQAMMEAVGDLALGRYVDYSCADFEDPEYHELASRYYEVFNEFMENDAVAAYGIVWMVAQAIEATGSDDPTQIAEHIRNNSFDTPGHAWVQEYTEWGEMASATPLFYVLDEGEPPEGVNPGANWYPRVLFRSDPLEPYEPGN